MACSCLGFVNLKGVIMSNGWNCDKCQKYFSQDNSEKRYRLIGAPHGKLTPEVEIDLCEKCKERFNKWAEAEPLYGTDFSFSVFDETPKYGDDLVYRPPRREPVPRVYFGSVHPFPNSDLNDKEFPKKMLEEAAEVYSAWEDYLEAVAKDNEDEILDSLDHIVLECGDVAQTCANMLYAARKTAQKIQPPLYDINVYDAQTLMLEIEKRNRERGRYDA